MVRANSFLRPPGFMQGNSGKGGEGNASGKAMGPNTPIFSTSLRLWTWGHLMNNMRTSQEQHEDMGQWVNGTKHMNNNSGSKTQWQHEFNVENCGNVAVSYGLFNCVSDPWAPECHFTRFHLFNHVLRTLAHRRDQFQAPCCVPNKPGSRICIRPAPISNQNPSKDWMARAAAFVHPHRIVPCLVLIINYLPPTDAPVSLGVCSA